jgi:hypothetical protein
MSEQTPPPNTFPISKETALLCITAIRHYYDKLAIEFNKTKNDPNLYSRTRSIEDYLNKSKEAYAELQSLTGDNTSLFLPK